MEYIQKKVHALVTVVKPLMVAALMLLSGGAQAVLILGVNDPTNNTANFTWSGSSVYIENTSNFDARITSFGFDSDPAVLGLTGVSGTEDNDAWSLIFNETVGGAGGGTFEFGVTTSNGGNKNLEGGHPNAGIAVGETGVFEFDLGFNLEFTDISNFFVRFQRTGADGEGSDRGRYCEGDCVPVSEPGTVVLLAFGAAGLIVGRRIQAKK